MPTTFGSAVRAKSTGLRGLTDSQVESQARQAMDDDTERPLLLGRVRQMFGVPQNVSDETLAERVRQHLDYSAHVAQDRMRQTRQGEAAMRMVGAYDKARTLAGENRGDKGAMERSSTLQRKIRDVEVETPHPENVIGKDGQSPRIPVVEDYREMQKLRDERGGHPEMPGWLSQQVVLLKGGKALASLNEKANYSQREVPGANVLSRVTGTGSWVKSAPLSGLRSRVWDMSEGSSLGKADVWDTSYGYREAGHDVGEKAGSAAPYLSTLLASGMSYPVKGLLHLAQGIDAAEAGVANMAGRAAEAAGATDLAKTLKQAGKENEQERDEYVARAQDVANFRQGALELLGKHGRPDADAQLRETGTEAGRWAGREAGEWGDFFAPTEGGIAVGRVGGKLAGTSLGKAAKIKAGQAKAAIGEVAANMPGARWLSDFTSRWGARRHALPGERLSQSDVGLTSKATTKHAVPTEEEALLQRVVEDTEAVLQKHGVPESQWDDVQRAAGEARAKPETMRDAPAVQQDLMDVWTRYDQENLDVAVARKAMDFPAERARLAKNELAQAEQHALEWVPPEYHGKVLAEARDYLRRQELKETDHSRKLFEQTQADQKAYLHATRTAQQARNDAEERVSTLVQNYDSHLERQIDTLASKLLRERGVPATDTDRALIKSQLLRTWEQEWEAGGLGRGRSGLKTIDVHFGGPSGPSGPSVTLKKIKEADQRVPFEPTFARKAHRAAEDALGTKPPPNAPPGWQPHSGVDPILVNRMYRDLRPSFAKRDAAIRQGYAKRDMAFKHLDKHQANVLLKMERRLTAKENRILKELGVPAQEQQGRRLAARQMLDEVQVPAGKKGTRISYRASPSPYEQVTPAAKELLKTTRHARSTAENALAEAAESLAKGKGLAWNPLHQQMGQNALRMNAREATLPARAGSEAGVETWVGRQVPAEEAARTPGLRTLDPERLASARVIEQRPISERAAVLRDLLTQQGHTRKEVNDAVRRMTTITPPQAIAQHRGDILRATAYGPEEGARIWANELPHMRQAEPDRFPELEELLERFPRPGGTMEGRTVSGTVRGGDIIQNVSLESHLRSQGLVILSVEGKTPTKAMSKAGRGVVESNTVVVPAHLTAEHGRIVPRNVAQMMVESTKAPHELNSAAARKAAQSINRIFGLSQMKLMATRGNMGFEQRNRINEILRIAMEEDAGAILSTKNRRLVAMISEAPVGRASGVRVVIGGRVFDTGELRTSFQRLGIIRGGFTDEMRKELAGDVGAGKIAERIGIGKANLGTVLDVGHKAGMAPGQAAAAMTDKITRSLFTVGGHKLHKTIAGDEGLRALATVIKMDRGLLPEVAAREAKHLLIDYGDKSAVEEIAGIYIPFVKYYTGSIRGALSTAAANPRRFANAAYVARALETWDQTKHGGALDPRPKPLMDQLAANPQMQMGPGRYGTVRNEAPSSELASWLSAASGQDEQNLLKFAYPWINQLGALSGFDPITGRSVFGFDENLTKGARHNVVSQYLHGLKEQQATGLPFLGKHPYAQAAYWAARQAPWLGGRLISSQGDVLLRTILGLGSAPASRLDEDSVGALLRAIVSATSGVRVPGFSPVAQSAKKAKETGAALGAGTDRAAGERIEKGRWLP